MRKIWLGIGLAIGIPGSFIVWFVARMIALLAIYYMGAMFSDG